MNDKPRPAYDALLPMDATRSPLAARFAEQIVSASTPFLPTEASAWAVLDVGSGYGATSIELGSRCASVRGIEPTSLLHKRANKALAATALTNVTFEQAGVESLDEVNAYDLVVLDNVYEHLPDHCDALDRIHRALKPGGVAFVLTPNKWWPIEAHYRLPFLSYVPLRIANLYLRCSGRGTDYTDASFAPTYRSLRREAATAGFHLSFVLPEGEMATMAGSPLHYWLGIRAIRRWPQLWAISKALMVILVKPDGTGSDRPERGSARAAADSRGASQD